MTKLNFHKDKNFLMDWLMLNQMTTGELIVWHTLMNIGNRLGQKSVFNAPTSTLTKYTGLSRQGVTNARKKLIDRGFIKYEKGHQSKAPIYEMIPLHQAIEPYFSFANPVELTPNLTQELTPTFTPNLTPELTIHKGKRSKEKSSSGSRGEMINLFKSYEENMNKLTPMIEEELKAWSNILDVEIVEEAIRESVKRGGRSFSYMETILKHWKRVGLKTLEEVKTYELEKELEKSNKLIPFRKPTIKAQSKDDLFAELLKEDF